MTSPLAKQFLESLQQGRHRVTGLPVPLQDPRERQQAYSHFLDAEFPDLAPDRRRAALDGYYELAVSQAATLESRYEDPIVYENLLTVASAVHGAARGCGYAEPDGVLLGTLDSGRVTATTYYLSSTNEYILTVNLGLWTIARQLAWIVAQAAQQVVRSNFPSDSLHEGGVGAAIRLRLAMDPSIAIRFSRLLYEWSVQGMPYPHASAMGTLETEFGTALQNSMKAFTIAHEYGHIVLGHYRGQGEVAMGAQGVGLDPSVKELQADDVAFRILQKMHRDEPSSTLEWAGAAAYFVSTEILSRTLGILKYGDEDTVEPSKTHPQPERRWGVLKGEIEELDLPVRQAATVETALRILWEQSRSDVQELRDNGVAVAPVWQSEAPTGGRAQLSV